MRTRKYPSVEQKLLGEIENLICLLKALGVKFHVVKQAVYK